MSGLDDLEPSERAAAYSDMVSEYNKSLDRQHDAISQLQEKALEVVKINFLVIGALVAGSSVFFDPGNRVAILLTATALCFVYSTWSAVKAYSSYKFFKHGWGPGDIEALRETRSVPDYHYITAKSYDYWLGVNRVRYAQPLRAFRRGLWAALTGVFIFSVLVLKVVEYPFVEPAIPPLVTVLGDVVVVGLSAALGVFGYRTTMPPQHSASEPTPPAVEDLYD